MGAIDTDAYVIESFALRDTCSKTEDSKTMEATVGFVRQTIPMSML